jgi:tetratricopeptide (TPR) repeat protein
MKPNVAVTLAMVLLSFGDAPVALPAGIIHGTSVPERLKLPEGVPEIDQAIVQFKKGDYEQCLSLLKTAAASRPDLFPAQVLFAKLCLLMDQPAMGRAALEQAAIDNPRLPETYLVFGRLALQDNRLTDAQLQFDKAMALAASGAWSDRWKHDFLVDAHAGLTEVAEQRKDWPAAAANLAAWLELEPKNGRARQLLAEALFRQGQRDKVQAVLEQAVKHDPSLEPAAILMGRLLTEVGDRQKAAEWMEYAVKSAPENPRVHLGYATWLLEQNQVERAKSEVEVAARLDPASSEPKGLRGIIAWQLKDYQTAEQIFQALHLESPANLTANNYWALAMAEQPETAKHQRALQVAQLNARLHPNSTEALTTVGWVAYRLGQLDQAEQSLRAAIASRRGSSETAYYLARVLADRQKNDEVPELLKISLAAPGRFAFRNEAQAWLDQLTKTVTADASKAGSN